MPHGHPSSLPPTNPRSSRPGGGAESRPLRRPRLCILHAFRHCPCCPPLQFAVVAPPLVLVSWRDMIIKDWKNSSNSAKSCILPGAHVVAGLTSAPKVDATRLTQVAAGLRRRVWSGAAPAPARAAPRRRATGAPLLTLLHVISPFAPESLIAPQCHPEPMLFLESIMFFFLHLGHITPVWLPRHLCLSFSNPRILAALNLSTA